MTSLARLFLALGLPGLLVAGTTAQGADADVAVALAARPSVVRVRWRDQRFSRMTSVRNAVVVRADGLLVMAGPPVAPGGTLTARLQDGRELPAELLASDARTALSLVRVRAAGLRPLELRREPRRAAPTGAAAEAPEPLRYAPIGLRVVMVTSDDSVAVGVVRSHRRQGTVMDPDTRRVETTTGLLGAALAAVDEDAGAPFLDSEGRLVGLLVGRKAVVAPEAGEEAAGVGLRLRPEPREAVAVPADVIRLVWPLLERHRKLPRAALGVSTKEVDDALRSQLDLEGGGHVVRAIEPDGSAQRAGLQLHDIIVSVDGLGIEPGTSMHDALLPYRPGQRVRLGIYRAGDRLEVSLELEERH